jgi:hypothetical protein
LSRRFLTPVALPYGNQNPTAGVTGALFFRTDLGEVYIYDGTTWGPVTKPSSTSVFLDTIDGGLASTTNFTSVVDGGNESSF